MDEFVVAIGLSVVAWIVIGVLWLFGVSPLSYMDGPECKPRPGYAHLVDECW